MRGKRHPAFLQRLGFSLPKRGNQKAIWIHAVSVGEVKSAIPLFRLLKQKFPGTWICITTTTATGLAEAKRALSDADAFLYMPLDLSWVARRFVRKIQPSYLFLIESDYWLHALTQVRKQGGKVFVVSGKISAKSAARFRFFSFFAKRLFSQVDCLCVQTEEYAERFGSFVEPSKLYVTGNLKFDMPLQAPCSLPQLSGFKWITLSSTHDPEEERLLDLLIGTPYSFFLAPRHPERFERVAELLTRKNISFIRWSQLDCFSGEKVVLVDTMGELATCYSHSLLAIVGGSFIPSVGGHNVWEPYLYGCPSLFGPFMHSQKELVSAAFKADGGMQISLEQVLDGVERVVLHREEYATRALKAAEKMRCITGKTWEIIASHIKN